MPPRKAPTSSVQRQLSVGEALHHVAEEFGNEEDFADVAAEFCINAKKPKPVRKREIRISRAYDGAGPVYPPSRRLMQPGGEPLKKGRKSDRLPTVGESPEVSAEGRNVGHQGEAGADTAAEQFQADLPDFADEGFAGPGLVHATTEAQAQGLEELQRSLEADLSLLTGLGLVDIDGAAEPKVGQAPESAWSQRRRQEYEAYKNLRTPLAAVRLSSCAVPFESPLCSQAGCNLTAEIRCKDCGWGGDQMQYFCSSHDNELHLFAHKHERECWCHGFWEKLPMCSTVRDGHVVEGPGKYWPAAPVQCVRCRATTEWSSPRVTREPVSIIGLTGRYDAFKAAYTCRSCGQEQIQGPLECCKLGAHPSSPDARALQTAFEDTLLQFFDNVSQRMPGSSSTGFAEVLGAFSRQHGRVGTVNPTAFRTAFAEWKYLRYELQFTDQRRTGLECPACATKVHSLMFDGNRKVFRWDRSYEEWRECYYGETFLGSNERVVAFTKEVDRAGGVQRADKTCGGKEWTAAGNKRSLIVGQHETGALLACCRHDILRRGVNLVQSGEQFSYTLRLKRDIRAEVDFKFAYGDVACKYDA